MAESYGNYYIYIFEEPSNCFPQRLHHFILLPTMYEGCPLSYAPFLSSERFQLS